MIDGTKPDATLPGQKRRLLLVEDDALIALAEKMALEERGYEVLVAPTGEAAIEACRGTAGPGPEGPDLVLMDIDLGKGMDGTEAAARILAERDLPLIFLSSHTEREIVGKTEGIGSYGYIAKHSGVVVIDASIKMAFKLRKAEKAAAEEYRLQEESVRARTLLEKALEQTPVPLALVSMPDAVFRVVNPACKDFLGIGEGEDPTGKPLAELQVTWQDFDLEGRSGRLEDLPLMRSLRGEKTLGEERRIVRRDGTERYALASASPILDAEGRLIAGYLTMMDITERKRAEGKLGERNKLLERSEERLHLAQEAAHSGAWEWDLRTNENAWTEEIWGLYGLEPGSCEPSFEAWLLSVHPEDRVAVSRAVETAAAAGSELNAEWRVLLPGGGLRWLLSRGKPFRDEAGIVVRYAGIVIDITDRKEAELRIEALLAEKLLLLREVHHRIKNNMGTVHSLLSLQAGRTGAREAREALLDAGNRVQSMMILYDKLYQAEGRGEVSVADYLPYLVERILAGFEPPPRFRLETAVADFPLDAKRLQPLGILVNELITNAMKYAFAGVAEPRLKVEAWIEGRVCLRVSDNGKGIPESVAPGRSPGFGLTLAGELAKQLDGELAIDRERGTSFTLRFPA